MEYPTLYVKDRSRQMVDDFGGYNHNMRIGENEFYNMKNMTSDHYPVLAPRKNRGVYKDGVQANAIIAKDKLCYVDGSAFVIGNDRIEMGLTDESKTLVSMGAYVIILPDRKYIDTLSKEDWGNIDAVAKTTGEVKVTPCTSEGATGMQSDTEPEEPFDGLLWLDTSSEYTHTLKQYSTDKKEWVSLTTNYVEISGNGISNGLNQYDGVNISGLSDDASHLNGSHILYFAYESGPIVIKGTIKKATTQNTSVTVTRKMPDLDYIVESGNRLWGCKYGNQPGRGFVNEIYASALGNFKNWDCFMGTSQDRYRSSCGTDGPFTGAIAYRGTPLFFKENFVYEVYGNAPSNFQIQSTACRGVQNGCGKSVAIVNETVFYKSRSGVCAFDGSMPVDVSAALGDVIYSNAVAGSHGNKYYISMKDEDGNANFFVYDTRKNLWHREDDLAVDAICSYKNDVYCIESGAKRIVSLFGTGVMDSKRVPWMVETGILGMTSPDMKYVSKLLLRLSLEPAAKVRVSIQYDSIGIWHQVCQMTAASLRSFSIPIKPHRCDHFRIRIEGEGIGRIYSITKTIEQGSDIS